MGLLGYVGNLIRQRRITRDFKIIWKGLVATAPENVALDLLVEHYGNSISEGVAKFYPDLVVDSFIPGPGSIVRRCAMNAILQSGSHSARDIETIRIHMGM